MTGIFNGIQKLINIIETIIEVAKLGIQYLVNLVKSMIDLIRLLITTTANTYTLIATLPSWLIAFATATISVAVLYVILGRSNGK